MSAFFDPTVKESVNLVEMFCNKKSILPILQDDKIPVNHRVWLAAQPEILPKNIIEKWFMNTLNRSSSLIENNQNIKDLILHYFHIDNLWEFLSRVAGTTGQAFAKSGFFKTPNEAFGFHAKAEFKLQISNLISLLKPEKKEEKLCKIRVFEGTLEKWIDVPMSEVYAGDILKMFNPDGTPAARGMLLEATDDAFIDSNESWSISTKKYNGPELPPCEFHGTEGHVKTVEVKKGKLADIWIPKERKSIEKIEDGVATHVLRQFQASVESIKEKMERYEEALRFYADQNKDQSDDWSFFNGSLRTGKRARAALGIKSN